MGVDGGAGDGRDELDRLEAAVAAETEAIADLQRLTRVLKAELAGWKPPALLPPNDPHGIVSGVTGFALGLVAMISLGRLLLLVFTR